MKTENTAAKTSGLGKKSDFSGGNLLKSGGWLRGLFFTGLVVFLLGCNTREVENGGKKYAGDPVIVLPKNADAIKKFAAEELKKHLELITGKPIEITDDAEGKKGFPFYVGIPFPDDKAELKREEARYRITPAGIYLYGEDAHGEDADLEKVLHPRVTRTGTMFAVYFFLENELGVKWMEPGDDGIAFCPRSELVFASKCFSWAPGLTIRQFSLNRRILFRNVPVKMAYNREEMDRIILEHGIWLRRMRLGSSEMIEMGHAFTDWWEKYGKNHPEYFALNPENGRREPYREKRPDLAKLCVANRNVQKQIVANWLERKKKQPELVNINVCDNDGFGFCACPECLKLDVRKEGEPLVACQKDGKNILAHMTDREVWFANEVLKLAREKYPDLKAVMYGYGCYLQAPRREKVSEGVIIEFVPTMLSGSAAIEKLYCDWKNMGAKEFIHRPNDMWLATGLPMGFEKLMFASLKTGFENGAIGMLFDSLITGSWEADGLGYYVIARAGTYPDRSFDDWEDEYCSGFGPAKDDMKEYFQYWRNNWDSRIWNANTPDKENVLQDAACAYQVVLRRMLDYFTAADFDATDAILAKASAKELSADARKRVEKMQLANKHSRLSMELLAAFSDENSSLRQKVEKAKEALNFRIENRDKIKMNWSAFLAAESYFGDDEKHKWDGPLNGAMAWAEAFFDGELEPLAQKPLVWKFKIDAEAAGTQEDLQNAKWTDVNKTWLSVNTVCSWDKPRSGLPEEIRSRLEKHDGKGWYAAAIKKDERMKDRKVYLVFGAADGFCRVYVNGAKAGENICKKDNAGGAPFTIRIDQRFDDGEWQQIRVCVSNATGPGGICKPVWLAAGK
ncbi:MAG: DUF4838 domain-containing protein [Kiritimatiellae bacterium]|nr:DUF4838 domain-containing protein [Kiritimatiellia bacterium]